MELCDSNLFKLLTVKTFTEQCPGLKWIQGMEEFLSPQMGARARH